MQGKLNTSQDYISAFWSVLFVALGMFIGLIIFNRNLLLIEGSQLKFMIGYGFTFAVFHSTWILSVQYNGAAVATFMVYSSPAVTAILSRWVFKENFNSIKLLSIVLSLAGTVLISGAYNFSTWNLNWPGILFGLLSAPFFAFYNLDGAPLYTASHSHPSFLFSSTSALMHYPTGRFCQKCFGWVIQFSAGVHCSYLASVPRWVDLVCTL